jgi:crotonobetainyl-CoA:carnitine CoA-transferase CaiB-like acyl-CoA transferase
MDGAVAVLTMQHAPHNFLGEPPRGDVSRVAFPRQGEISGYYAQQNAGKRNISIDLNVPGARDVALKLCDTADIVVENFAVVYVSISGYGQSGSWRTRMAYAPSIQAEMGFTLRSRA